MFHEYHTLSPLSVTMESPFKEPFPEGVMISNLLSLVELHDQQIDLVYKKFCKDNHHWDTWRKKEWLLLRFGCTVESYFHLHMDMATRNNKDADGFFSKLVFFCNERLDRLPEELKNITIGSFLDQRESTMEVMIEYYNIDFPKYYDLHMKQTWCLKVLNIDLRLLLRLDISRSRCLNDSLTSRDSKVSFPRDFRGWCVPIREQFTTVRQSLTMDEELCKFDASFYYPDIDKTKTGKQGLIEYLNLSKFSRSDYDDNKSGDCMHCVRLLAEVSRLQNELFALKQIQNSCSSNDFEESSVMHVNDIQLYAPIENPEPSDMEDRDSCDSKANTSYSGDSDDYNPDQ